MTISGRAGRKGRSKFHKGKRPSQAHGRKHRSTDAPFVPPFEGAQLVTITELAEQGDGVVQHDSGLLYIENALPGEEHRVKVVSKAGRDWRAVSVERLTAAENRIDPPCPHFESCGGCALQHMDEGEYQRFKRGKLQTLLSDHGFDPAILSDMFMTTAESRRRTSLHLRHDAEAVRLGYLARRSHKLEDIDTCPVLHPALSACFDAVREMGQRLLKPGENVKVHLTLCDDDVIDLVFTDLSCPGRRFTDPDAVAWLGRWGQDRNIGRISLFDRKESQTILHLADTLLTFGKARIAPAPAGFLQASRQAESYMISTAMTWLSKFKKAADLFCGAGTFTLPMAGQGKVLAIENDHQALSALKAASGAMRYKPELLERDLFQAPLSFMEMKKLDAVLFDPPRAGAEAQAHMLVKGKVPRVVAVSCNPQTLMRDIAILCDGGYVLKDMVAIDQFLWSPHLEAMAHLEYQPS